jgi:hypothetical protein
LGCCSAAETLLQFWAIACICATDKLMVLIYILLASTAATLLLLLPLLLLPADA